MERVTGASGPGRATTTEAVWPGVGRADIARGAAAKCATRRACGGVPRAGGCGRGGRAWWRLDGRLDELRHARPADGARRLHRCFAILESHLLRSLKVPHCAAFQAVGLHRSHLLGASRFRWPVSTLPARCLSTVAMSGSLAVSGLESPGPVGRRGTGARRRGRLKVPAGPRGAPQGRTHAPVAGPR